MTGDQVAGIFDRQRALDKTHQGIAEKRCWTQEQAQEGSSERA